MPFAFPFTFKFFVPGIYNPFASSSDDVTTSPNRPSEPFQRSNRGLDRRIISSSRRVASSTTTRRVSLSPAPPSFPSSTLPIPENRKRGWEPAFAESMTATTLACSNGYLDTPAKYREFAASAQEEIDFDEIEAMAASVAELPPAKRRRGLAGSIVSTAFSAALIGTAVGLTVYRLWRDRSRDEYPDMSPPPPYNEVDWSSNSPSSSAPESPTKRQATIKVTPATPRTRRPRHPVGSVGRRTTPRRSRQRAAGSSSSYIPAQHIFPETQPEFNFGHQEEDAGEEDEDEMDWIGGKLAQLIQEGNKALGREVVVMSEAQEDEVDDGNGAWEEDDPTGHQARSSGSLSPMRTRPSRLNLAVHSPSRLYPSSASPTRSRFDLAGGSALYQHSGASASASSLSLSTSYREEATQWDSPALKESMERARALARQNRASAS